MKKLADGKSEYRLMMVKGEWLFVEDAKGERGTVPIRLNLAPRVVSRERGKNCQFLSFRRNEETHFFEFTLFFRLEFCCPSEKTSPQKRLWSGISVGLNT